MTASGQLKRHWHMVTVYSATHFLVDFSCAFLMLRSFSHISEAMLYVLLYNFCAFALQMPLGLIADRVNKNHQFALVGCLLIAAAFFMVPMGLAAVLIVGLGNALFHIGGGIDVLNVSKHKLSALGIFVSPGAFGIYLGTLLGRGSEMPALFFPVMLVVAAAAILVTYQLRKGSFVSNAPLSFEGVNSRAVIAAIACLFFVVCLRSYVGLSLDFSWKSIGYWGVALVCAVVFGKTIGGMLADRLGVTKTTVVSLGASALLFLLPSFPIAGVFAVLLFNMTMPITLWALARIMPGAKGFAFGLLTFALFLGFLPVYFGFAPAMEYSWLFSLCALVSLVLLLIGLRRVKP